MTRLTCASLLSASLGSALAAPHSERGGLQATTLADSPSPTAATLNPRRSLAIVDDAVVSSISLRMVMDQLVSQAGDTGFTSEQLFRQLWDTQNPAPGQPDLPGGAHCSDNGNTLNGAPYACRPGEGAEAQPSILTTLARYSLVGLTNRFDLAPADGANCGEYRMVFARDPIDRNFVIFEAVLPNPNPELGLEGCRPVALAWARLSTTENPVARRRLVRSLFFDGMGPGQDPIIHFNHYGNNPAAEGQIRTNQFMRSLPHGPDAPWLLREFKLKRDCSAGACTLRFVPVTVKANPRGEFFDADNTDPLAVAFRSHFITQVSSLAVDDVNRFNYEVPDIFNAAQSNSMSAFVVDDYVAQFLGGPENNPFAQAIHTELQRIGSPLTPAQIVARAQVLSCGGCHNRSSNADIGGTQGFPTVSPAFVHINEDREFTAPPPEGELAHPISSTPTNILLPFRQQILGAFLDTPALGATQVLPLSRIPTVFAGQPFTGKVTVTNAGTTLWSAANGTRAASLEGTGDLLLAAGDAILLGQQKLFSFTATAPLAPGRFTSRWRMQRNGVPFGAELTYTVNVKSPPFAAERVELTLVPATLAPGESFQFSVKLKNWGTSPWSAASQVELASQNPADNTTWGVARVPLTAFELILPGQEASFAFTAVAPALPGTYPFEWRLVHGTEAFGESTLPLRITVEPPSSHR